jgi:rhodanese-related sulfurtransferase
MKHLEPQAVWVYLHTHPQAVFVDVRMEIEHLYVGHPPGIVHIAWYEYPDMVVDAPSFVASVLREAGDDLQRPVVLMCRSGTRTLPAGAALEAAGFTEVVNMLHGFEGDADDQFQRGHLNGWRFDGLPWLQM